MAALWLQPAVLRQTNEGWSTGAAASHRSVAKIIHCCRRGLPLLCSLRHVQRLHVIASVLPVQLWSIAAVRKGHAAVVKLLLDGGAGANTANDNDSAPLQHAARHGYPEIVGLLLAAGAEPATVDNFGRTALQLAKDYKRDGCVALLMNATPSPAAEKQPPPEIAAATQQQSAESAAAPTAAAPTATQLLRVAAARSPPKPASQISPLALSPRSVVHLGSHPDDTL